MRNIKIYLRDKTAVFFSFLSLIILLVLYLLFLANNLKPTGMDEILTDSQLTFMVYAQLIPGLIVINSVSIPLGNLGNVINDFEYRQIDGFLVTPVKRFKFILGYYVASFIITVVLSSLLVLAAYFIMSVLTGVYVYWLTYVQSILLTVLFSFISTAIMIFVTSLIRSINAYGALSGVLGTLIGFVSGIYMPLFVLPEFMSKVASIIPFTHMNIMLKRIVLPQAFELIDASKFDSESTYLATIDRLKEVYGYNEIGIFGFNVDIVWIMVGSLLLSLGLLFAATIMMNRRIKN
jgi:multidrug/hemolysin transport system permease protein